MWQIYSLFSILAGAFETVTDKAGIVRDGGVDSYVASFLRGILFLCASVLVGLTGLIGELSFFFHWSLLLFALVGATSTILFTYLLRTVELTAIGAAAYVTPFFFLLVDTYLLDAAFSKAQILGANLAIEPYHPARSIPAVKML